LLRKNKKKIVLVVLQGKRKKNDQPNQETRESSPMTRALERFSWPSRGMKKRDEKNMILILQQL